MISLERKLKIFTCRYGAASEVPGWSLCGSKHILWFVVALGRNYGMQGNERLREGGNVRQAADTSEGHYATMPKLRTVQRYSELGEEGGIDMADTR